MIELIDIYKSFGSVQALQGVNLRVEPGSIHGIVGENGAGKSTLMKVLTGFNSLSSGSIRCKAESIYHYSPRRARALGIGMLYQEPMDYLQLSVLDNFMAGSRTYDRHLHRKRLLQLSVEFGFTLDPDAALEELTIGERQQLELLRLIGEDTQTLILDEPTTGISIGQRRLLFSALKSLCDQGTAILFVSHKLEEVAQLCDTVTVLRRGKVADRQQRPFNRKQLVRSMFDSLPEHRPQDSGQASGPTLLELQSVTSTIGKSGLNTVSARIRAGEVVGLAGLDGSGQSVFLKIAGGLLQPMSGTVRSLGSRPCIGPGNGDARIVFLPADRSNEGLIAGMTIREHHLLTQHDRHLLPPGSGRDQANLAIADHSILGSPDTAADSLSGGNQQRLLHSLIPKGVRLILMENPTRGLDIRSAAWTWSNLRRHVATDGAIVFASPDLEEIMEQATRILVFLEGSIILDTPTHATSYQLLSEAITGTSQTMPIGQQKPFTENPGRSSQE